MTIDTADKFFYPSDEEFWEYNSSPIGGMHDEVKVVLHPYDPRVTDIHLEVAAKPTSPLRVTQVYEEVAYKPVYPHRVTMLYLEVLYKPGNYWTVFEA